MIKQDTHKMTFRSQGVISLFLVQNFLCQTENREKKNLYEVQCVYSQTEVKLCS